MYTCIPLHSAQAVQVLSKSQKKRMKQKAKAAAAAAEDGDGTAEEGAENTKPQNGHEEAGDDDAAADAGGDDAAAKKKKKKKKKGVKQTEPPTVPLARFFPDGVYPEGEWQSYNDECVLRHACIHGVREHPLCLFIGAQPIHSYTCSPCTWSCITSLRYSRASTRIGIHQTSALTASSTTISHNS